MKKVKYVKVRRADTRKITEVTNETIIFDTGETITFDHEQDCCEWNYADFEQLDDLARNYIFEGRITFEPFKDKGFLFGDSRRKFFVPCYSSQNGYYSSDIDIYFNGVPILEGIYCEENFD